MKKLMTVVGGAWCLVLCASVTQAESVEDYYDTSDRLVQSFPIGKVRTVDYAPTAEEIAAADAAIDAAGGSGPKLAPPLAVQNMDGTLTIIRGGVIDPALPGCVGRAGSMIPPCLDKSFFCAMLDHFAAAIWYN